MDIPGDIGFTCRIGLFYGLREDIKVYTEEHLNAAALEENVEKLIKQTRLFIAVPNT